MRTTQAAGGRKRARGGEIVGRIGNPSYVRSPTARDRLVVGRIGNPSYVRSPTARARWLWDGLAIRPTVNFHPPGALTDERPDRPARAQEMRLAEGVANA